MGRRRRKEGVVEALMVLPWWIGVGLGIVAFIALRWIVPPALPPLVKSLAPLLQTFSWLALALFGIPGLISLVRGKTKAGTVIACDTPRARAKAFSGAAHDSPDPRPSPSSSLQTSSPSQVKARDLATELQQKALDSWSVTALRELEWKRFELLCAKYYEAVGFKSETIRCGADGGIDIKLYRIDPTQPLAVVQCKAWNSAVGVKEVRELLGVMAHEKVGRGVFITTSSFTKDAQSFGQTNPIQLLDGSAFVGKMQELPKEKQDALLKFAFEGDFKTPTCASCGVKMVRREGKGGSLFWGCRNYPKCRNKIQIRTA